MDGDSRLSSSQFLYLRSLVIRDDLLTLYLRSLGICNDLLTLYHYLQVALNSGMEGMLVYLNSSAALLGTTLYAMWMTLQSMQSFLDCFRVLK